MTKRRRNTMSMSQRFSMAVGAVILALAALGTIGWVSWWLVSLIPPDGARLLLLLALAALPFTAWAGWYFGHVKAEGVLAGLDKGIDRVMGAATKTAGLRVTTVQTMRGVSPQADPPPAAVLPPARITRRELPTRQTVIDL